MRQTFTFLLIVISFSALRAQKLPTNDSLKVKKVKILVTPLLGYQPATKIYGGTFSMFTFHFSKDTLTRLSNIGIDLRYTMNKQFLSEIAWDFSFDRQKYISKGIINFNKMPLYFYGIGNKSLEIDKELYDNRILNFHIELNRKIHKGLFVGGVANFTNISKYESIDKINLGNGTITGDKNGTSSGIGISLVKDTRDNVFSASDGEMFNVTSLLNSKIFASDFQYSHFLIDLRKYYPIFNKSVLAIQVKSSFIFGDAPFWKLSQLGSPYDMRGYYPGRFRDKHYISFQTEYRFPIYWRFGGAIFAGLGEVSNDILKWDALNSKPTLGSGLRFIIDKKAKSKIRFDYAIGKNSQAFYISFAEAF